MTTNTGQQGKRAGTRVLGQEAWQDSKDRTARTGQPGQDSQDRTARTGQPGQDSHDRKAGECRDGTGRTRKRGHYGQNMTEGQSSWDRTTEMGQP
jgi:hypothetical protein